MLGERIMAGVSQLTVKTSGPSKGAVLLVEDDPRDIELTVEGLRQGQVTCDLIIARDGAAALDYLRQKAGEGPAALPDVVLLDLKLPKLGGIDVLSIIRSEPALRHLQVVTLTSSAEPNDAETAAALGCDGYVIKPRGLISYMTTVGRLLGETASD